MGFSLNQVVKPQTTEFNKKAKVFSNELSPIKRLYVEGKKERLSKRDLIVMLKSLSKVYKVPFSMVKTVKLIKADRPSITKQISQETFNDFEELIKSLSVDDYGFFEVTSERLFRGCGVP